MSLFGPSPIDQRDFMVGLAGLTAGIHSLRILAERGIASPADLQLSIDAITPLIDAIPPGQILPEKLEALKEVLRKIVEAAEANYGTIK